MDIEKATDVEILTINNKFGRLDVEDDEFPGNTFNHIGILDVFSYCLSEHEAVEFLSSFKDHNLKYEDKFKSFFKEIFLWIQEKAVYIHVGTSFNKEFKNMKPSDFKDFRNRLSKEEYNLLLQLVEYKTNTFKVDSIEGLLFFVTLSTREISFSNFFIPELETVVIGNYELSFPIYSKQQNAFNQCEKYAKDVGLFIRR
ncbi:hypothetical protein [Bacillus alkalicellulosilyticus]|uniref:hypothetical protein n=1 Tax=Alkalihalobacterium alkalicellulosilyticum TaxID=1912214 RepID=UPI00099621C7|nr:hypothetical protein [Bacillus alkalicellulosilyticus]